MRLILSSFKNPSTYSASSSYSALRSAVLSLCVLNVRPTGSKTFLWDGAVAEGVRSVGELLARPVC